MSHLDEFKEKLDLALRVHNAARCALPPESQEGHFVNENTLIRIDEELEAIRDRLGVNWLKRPRISTVPGFDAYITMRVYRNSIVHNRGRLSDQFHGCPDPRRNRSQFHANYKRFCDSVGVPPLQPGGDLMLSAHQPDFLTKLIEGVREFAEQVLR